MAELSVAFKDHVQFVNHRLGTIHGLVSQKKLPVKSRNSPELSQPYVPQRNALAQLKLAGLDTIEAEREITRSPRPSPPPSWQRWVKPFDKWTHKAPNLWNCHTVTCNIRNPYGTFHLQPSIDPKARRCWECNLLKGTSDYTSYSLISRWQFLTEATWNITVSSSIRYIYVFWNPELPHRSLTSRDCIRTGFWCRSTFLS